MVTELVFYLIGVAKQHDENTRRQADVWHFKYTIYPVEKTVVNSWEIEAAIRQEMHIISKLGRETTIISS